jgi:antirestriction protein
MQSTELDLTADVIDVRDVIARVETLEDECDDTSALNTPEARAELAALHAIMDELKGYGGDEQWRGDWYPAQLIDDEYFVEYATDLVVECGDITRDWPHYVVVDWERTARNIREDYSTVDVDGRVYWYR